MVEELGCLCLRIPSTTLRTAYRLCIVMDYNTEVYSGLDNAYFLSKPKHGMNIIYLYYILFIFLFNKHIRNYSMNSFCKTVDIIHRTQLTRFITCEFPALGYGHSSEHRSGMPLSVPLGQDSEAWLLDVVLCGLLVAPCPQNK